MVVANSFVLFLYWRKPVLRKKSNMIIISLAVSDLSSGLVTIPLVVSCAVSSAVTEPKCFAMDICQRFLSLSTILHLFAATMERYLRILKPLHSIAMVTNRRLVCVLSSIWVVSLTASALQLAWTDLQNASSNEAGRIEIVYSMTILCVFVFLPFVLMIVAFTHMFVVIKRKKTQLSDLVGDGQRAAKRNKRRRVQKRSVLVYSAMTLTYAAGWFPYFFLTYMGDLEQKHYWLPLWLDTLLLYAKFATSLLNPILYTFFKTDFQSALRSLKIARGKTSSNNSTSQLNLSSLLRSRVRERSRNFDNSLL